MIGVLEDWWAEFLKIGGNWCIHDSIQFVRESVFPFCPKVFNRWCEEVALAFLCLHSVFHQALLQRGEMFLLRGTCN